MALKDELGTRMKEYYESIPKTKLMRRTPVAIRIDGKAFHTFTSGFDRPFDGVLRNAMNMTMCKLCTNIQGCVLGYCQSDEITLILVDYKELHTAAWFDYEVQKLCSVSASMATAYFNEAFAEQIRIFEELKNKSENVLRLLTRYKTVAGKAMFDARCFNIPKEEVTNLLYWRQLDASRNSVQLVGQTYFKPSELLGMSCQKIQDMLMERFHINWNDFPTSLKRGTCCVRKEYEENGETRSRWEIDYEIPMFKGDDRDYIERLINFDEK